MSGMNVSKEWLLLTLLRVCLVLALAATCTRPGPRRECGCLCVGSPLAFMVRKCIFVGMVARVPEWAGVGLRRVR